jgi:hypothetical protein
MSRSTGLSDSTLRNCPRRVELFDIWLIRKSDHSTKGTQAERQRYATSFKLAGGRRMLDTTRAGR